MRNFIQSVNFFLHCSLNAAPVSILMLVLLAITQGAITYLQLHSLTQVIDSLARPNSSQGLIYSILLWGFTLISPQLLAPIFQLIQNTLSEKLTAFVNLLLISHSEKTLGLDVYESNQFDSKIKTILDGVASRPTNAIVMLVFVIKEGVSLTAILTFLAGTDAYLPLMVLFGFALEAWALLRFREKSWDLVLDRSDDAKRLKYLTQIAFAPENAAESKSFQLHSWLKQQYLRLFETNHHTAKQKRRDSLLGIVPFSLINLLIFSAALYYLFNGMHAKFAVQDAGKIAATLQALASLYLVAGGMSESLSIFYERVLYFSTLKQILDTSSHVKNPIQPCAIEKIDSLSFSEVGFTYSDGRTALEGINFTLARNEVLAIVGDNGAGKSTLIKLLLRFYDTTQGQILLNGTIDLRKVDVNCWRKKISCVFQDFVRYHFTVKGNIALNQDGDEHSKLNDALISSGLSDQLLGPDTLTKQLGKPFGGTELSGGQWQRLALARAFYKDADIILFDEPTSALDPRAEIELFEQVRRYAINKMAVVITHRLSSASQADKILVMRHGKIVESGNHKQLLALNGEYAKLWEIQSRPYQNASRYRQFKIPKHVNKNARMTHNAAPTQVKCQAINQ